jgi:iron complex transport system ATP-binding protein
MLASTSVVFNAGGRAIVDRVTAEFEPGRLHVIVGPNGAGKSTLLRLLARSIRPNLGAVLYDRADVIHRSERDLARCRAVLSQAIEITLPLSVRELLMMGRYPHFGSRPAATDESVCDEVIDFFDISAFTDRQYETLSGGEKQRVQFARVLAQIWIPVAGSSRFLFLDEPLTFLDIRHQLQFMQKLRTFSSQSDVIAVAVLHDLNLAASFADRLLLLDRGCVVSDGTPADVIAGPQLQCAFGILVNVLTDPRTGKDHVVFDSISALRTDNDQPDPFDRGSYPP